MKVKGWIFCKLFIFVLCCDVILVLVSGFFPFVYFLIIFVVLSEACVMNVNFNDNSSIHDSQR